MRMETVIIERITAAELAKELRECYIQKPPGGMISKEVYNLRIREKSKR